MARGAGRDNGWMALFHKLRVVCWVARGQRQEVRAKTRRAPRAVPTGERATARSVGWRGAHPAENTKGPPLQAALWYACGGYARAGSVTLVRTISSFWTSILTVS